MQQQEPNPDITDIDYAQQQLRIPQQILNNVVGEGVAPDSIVAQIKRKNHLKRTQQRKKINRLKKKRRIKQFMQKHDRIMTDYLQVIQQIKQQQLAKVKQMQAGAIEMLPPSDKQLINDEKQTLNQIIQASAQQKIEALQEKLAKMQQLERQNQRLKALYSQSEQQRKKLPGLAQYIRLRKKQAQQQYKMKVQKIRQETERKINQTKASIRNFVRGIKQAIKNRIDKGVSAIKNTYNSTVDSLQQLSNAINQKVQMSKQWYQQKKNKISNGFKQIGNDINQGLKSTGRGIYSGVKSVGKGISAVGKGIGTGALYAGAGALMATQKIGQGVVGGAKYIGKGIGQGYKYVKNKFKGKQGQTDQKSGFFANLWNGIKDKASMLAGMAVRAGTFLKDSAKSIIQLMNTILKKLNITRLIRTFGASRIPEYLRKYVFNEAFWALVGIPLPPFLTTILKDLVQNFFLGSTNALTGRIPSFTDHILVNGIDGIQDWKQFGVLAAGQTLGKYGDALTGGYISNFLFPQKQAKIFDDSKESFTSKLTDSNNYDYSSYAFGGPTSKKQDIQNKIKNATQKQKSQWGWDELIPGQLNQRRWKVRSYGPSRVSLYQQGTFMDQMKHTIQKNHFGADVLRVLQKKIQEKQIEFNNRRQQLLRTGRISQQQYEEQLQKDMKTMQKYITSLQLTHKLIMAQIRQIKSFISNPNTKLGNGTFYIEENGVVVKSIKIPPQLVPYLVNWRKQIDFDSYVINRLVNQDIRKVDDLQKKINQMKIQEQYDDIPLLSKIQNQASGFGGAFGTIAKTIGGAAANVLTNYVLPKVIVKGVSNIFPQSDPIVYPTPKFQGRTQQKKKMIRKPEKTKKKEVYHIWPMSKPLTAKQFFDQGRPKGWFEKTIDSISDFFSGTKNGQLNWGTIF